MANASLVGGCAAASCGQLGTNTYFLHKQEVLASRLQFSSLALASCASAVPDAACLVGLPTRCQLPHSSDLSMQDAGLPISLFLHNSLHTPSALFVWAFDGGVSVSNAFMATWVGGLLGLLSTLVVLGWGLFFFCWPESGRKRNRKRSEKKPKLGSRFKQPVPLFRDRLVCSECRWVGGGKGRMRRLKGPRVVFRDKQWAFANEKLCAWVKGKGASEAQAKALAARPRRKRVCQGQLWACRWNDKCFSASTQRPVARGNLRKQRAMNF